MNDASSVKVETRAVLRDANGRLLPGSKSLNLRGRPRGSGARPNLAAVARQMCADKGTTLEAALGLVLDAMIRKAVAGDVDAARLVLTRLAEAEAVERMRDGFAALALPAPPPVALPTEAELLAAIRDLQDWTRQLTVSRSDDELAGAPEYEELPD